MLWGNGNMQARDGSSNRRWRCKHYYLRIRWVQQLVKFTS